MIFFSSLEMSLTIAIASTLKQVYFYLEPTPRTMPRASSQASGKVETKELVNYISRVFVLDFYLQTIKHYLPQIIQQVASTAGKDTLLLISTSWTRLSPSRPKLMSFAHVATPNLHEDSQKKQDFYSLGKQLSRLLF